MIPTKEDKRVFCPDKVDHHGKTMWKYLKEYEIFKYVYSFLRNYYRPVSGIFQETCKDQKLKYTSNKMHIQGKIFK